MGSSLLNLMRYWNYGGQTVDGQDDLLVCFLLACVMMNAGDMFVVVTDACQ